MNPHTTINLPTVTPDGVAGLPNVQVLYLLRTLIADARQTRLLALWLDPVGDPVVARMAMALDPAGITAAYEYWPVTMDLLATEADRRGLAWR